MSAVKILVTTDGSNLSDKAVDTAIELAEQVGGSVVGMTVVLSAAPAGGFTEEEPIVKERLEAISHKAAEKQVPCEVVVEHAETVSQGGACLRSPSQCHLYRDGEPRSRDFWSFAVRQRNSESA